MTSSITSPRRRPAAIRGIALAALLAGLAPASAHAADYVLFDAFNGTTTGTAGSGYTFGYAATGAFGGTLTPFDAPSTAGCGGDANLVCARSAVVGEVGIYKAVANGGAYDPANSSFFDAGELNFHPGTGGQNAGFRFDAVIPGQYSYTIGLSSNDNSGRHSVDYRLFQGTTLLRSGILDETAVNLSGTAVNLSGVADTSAGSAFTLLIGANNDFRFDSTGVRATFSTRDATVPSPVPEPATWALMLAGFGMTAGALRGYRRRSPVTA